MTTAVPDEQVRESTTGDIDMHHVFCCHCVDADGLPATALCGTKVDTMEEVDSSAGHGCLVCYDLCYRWAWGVYQPNCGHPVECSSRDHAHG